MFFPMGCIFSHLCTWCHAALPREPEGKRKRRVWPVIPATWETEIKKDDGQRPAQAKNMRPYLKNNLKQKGDGGYDSSGGVPA
jgi:hypothetical protein